MSMYETMERRRRERKEEFSRGNVKGRYERVRLSSTPRLFQLIPGDFKHKVPDENGNETTVTMPYKEYRRHYVEPAANTKNKNPIHTCSRELNPFTQLERCSYCMNLENEPMAAYAFHVLGLDYYHEFTQRSEKTGRPFTRWVACEATQNNPNCSYCNSGYAKKLGHQLWMDCGTREFETLYTSLHLPMRNFCACGGNIVRLQASCPHCATVVLDAKKMNLSDSAFSSALNEERVCPSCQTRMYPAEIPSCDKCASPKPLGMFDCAFKAYLEDQVDGSRAKMACEIVARGPIHEAYAPQYKDLYDVSALVAPEPLGKQMKILGLKTMSSAMPSDPNSVPRGSLGVTPPVGGTSQQPTQNSSRPQLPPVLQGQGATAVPPMATTQQQQPQLPPVMQNQPVPSDIPAFGAAVTDPSPAQLPIQSPHVDLDDDGDDDDLPSF